MKHKLREWFRRYLPAEILATVFSVVFAGIVQLLTGNAIAAAYAGSIGDGVGYYGYLIPKDIAKSLRAHKKKGIKYTLSSFNKTIRNLLVEFGLSETLDTFFVRPFCMWIMPIIFQNFIIGIIIGKIVADVIFYIPTIIGYELRKKHLDE